MTAEFTTSTLELLAKSLEGNPFASIIFLIEDKVLKIIAVSNLNKDFQQGELPDSIPFSQEDIIEVQNRAGNIFYAGEIDASTPELLKFASTLGFEKFAILKVEGKEKVLGIVLVGSYQDQVLSKESLQPHLYTIQLINVIFEQDSAIKSVEKQIAQTDTLTAIVESIKTPWDTTAFFEVLHEQIRKSIGDFAFIGALYDEKTASISIPYLNEDGEIRTIEAFPLGEGLTSILLRTKQPLLLVENTEEEAKRLGAKIDGKPAKSWMGVPLMVQDQAIGALIIQDLEREKAFSQDHLDYLTSLANQIAKIVYNARILDESRTQIYKIQTAAEIARDISSALNLDELLLKAVNLIHDQFDFYHASVFLVDAAEKNAIIREATGEAGAQMKRTGHKLAVGSKSVVGFVSKQGEPLVINDVTKDATHLPNPMLPDTRAEAAIPLKIGDRTLGVLDVQSTVPYSFSPDDIDTFQTLADQLAIAVNNTELFAETQEHLSQHRLLHHITTSAASGTTLDEALTAAVEGLQVTLGGDRVAILLSDEERKNLEVKAWVGYSEETAELTVPFGTGITGWVAAHRKPLRINDITKDARYIQVSANTRSEMALPLIFRSDILGVLNVESEQVAAYTDNDEEMLGTLAGSLAAIIANTRLVEQIRKRAERERQLYEISSKIRRSTDVQTILSTTVNELSRVTGARRTQITVGIPEDEPREVDQVESAHKSDE